MKIINDMDQFLAEEGDLYIFGAGSCGYWIGYYMERCNIPFSGYIDRAAKQMTGQNSCYGKVAMTLESFRDQSEKNIRVIVGTTDYHSAVYDLVLAENKYGLLVTCIIPEYYDRYFEGHRYNINKFLGYFRHRLLKNDKLSIISNNCLGSIFYSALGMPIMSPTIDLGIHSRDYIKLCENLEYYLSKELSDINIGREFIAYHNFQHNTIQCKCGDLRFYCYHDKREFTLDRWNILRKRVDYTNLAWVLSDIMDRIDNDVIERFRQLPGKKMIVTTRMPINANGIDCYYYPEVYEAWTRPFEYWIDLVGWINN